MHGTPCYWWPQRCGLNKCRLWPSLQRKPGFCTVYETWWKTLCQWWIAADCLVIDSVSAPHVDIIVDVAPIGTYTNRKSVVMVQNLLSPELEQMHWAMKAGPILLESCP
jgi:hypothetical protein